VQRRRLRDASRLLLGRHLRATRPLMADDDVDVLDRHALALRVGVKDAPPLPLVLARENEDLVPLLHVHLELAGLVPLSLLAH
jgi:hypothetical protein